MGRRPTGLPRPRLAARDAAAEAVAGIVQRPGRAALTMLGTVLGVGAFVAVLGMTATGAGQISHQFTVLRGHHGDGGGQRAGQRRRPAGRQPAPSASPPTPTRSRGTSTG